MSTHKKIQLRFTVEAFVERLKNAFGRIGAMAQAIGMLNYDEKTGYKANLTTKQSRLVDAVSNYALPDIGKHITISDGIKANTKELEPKSCGYER